MTAAIIPMHAFMRITNRARYWLFRTTTNLVAELLTHCSAAQ